MKAIVCEMCSSRDVIKQDGFYICQSCGTKYTTEDAKKLMVEVEGKVDVSGSTVKVDNSQSLDNLWLLARRAKATGNASNAAKYYEMIAMQLPDNWEASFYCVYFTAADCKIGQMESAANSVTKVIPSIMQQIKESVPQSEQKAAYTEVGNMISSLCAAMYNTATEQYYKFSDIFDYQSRNRAAFTMLFAYADYTAKLFGENKLAASLYQQGYGVSGIDKEIVNKSLEKYDPELAQKNKNDENAETKKKAGQSLRNAFIALAIILICVLIGVLTKASYIIWIGAIIFVPIGIGYLISYLKKKNK